MSESILGNLIAVGGEVRARRNKVKVSGDAGWRLRIDRGLGM